MPDPLTPPATIDAVIDRLDAEIARAVAEESRLAYFACLYRGVTARVRDGIAAGRFEDGPRMARLDVVFACRYLDALDAYRAGRPTTRCWTAAFDAARDGRLVILQDLLLGMNAHINLDLGIAAAEVAPGAALPALRRDFHEISVLLGEMLDDVQTRLGRVSPWLGLLDWVGGRRDERVFSFGLTGARDLAWEWAARLARVSDAARPAEIERLDHLVCALAGPIQRPGRLVGLALRLVRSREPREVHRVVAALS